MRRLHSVLISELILHNTLCDSTVCVDGTQPKCFSHNSINAMMKGQKSKYAVKNAILNVHYQKWRHVLNIPLQLKTNEIGVDFYRTKCYITCI